MIISQTPLRISFFGGGTDYVEYYRRHGGVTLGTSIDKYTYITVSPLAPLFEHQIGAYYSRVERVSNLNELQHPSIRECCRFLGINNGIEIHIASDLPARTGLGSSSSFTVGLLNALYAFKGHNVGSNQLARDAVHIEHNMIKERVGCQDQYTCSIGGFLKIQYAKDGSIDSKRLNIPEDRLNLLQKHLMLFYTGIQRSAHEILEEQISNTQNGLIDDVLSEVKCLVEDGVQILVDSNSNLDEFGGLLHRAWDLKRKFSTKITNHAIDNWYSKAKNNGAIGGKLLGAGGGGFLLLFVEIESRQRIREALVDLHEVKFRFIQNGAHVVFQNI